MKNILNILCSVLLSALLVSAQRIPDEFPVQNANSSELDVKEDTGVIPGLESDLPSFLDTAESANFSDFSQFEAETAMLPFEDEEEEITTTLTTLTMDTTTSTTSTTTFTSSIPTTTTSTFRMDSAIDQGGTVPLSSY